MHGLGNDYIVMDYRNEKISGKKAANLAKKLCERRFSVGADGLLLVSTSKVADAKMRIFNADGSEAEMCGNGIRCVAKYVYEHKLAKAGGPVAMGNGTKYSASLKIETGAGILTVGLALRGKIARKVCVDMGEPKFRPKEIPVNLP